MPAQWEGPSYCLLRFFSSCLLWLHQRVRPRVTASRSLTTWPLLTPLTVDTGSEMSNAACGDSPRPNVKVFHWSWRNTAYNRGPDGSTDPNNWVLIINGHMPFRLLHMRWKADTYGSCLPSTPSGGFKTIIRTQTSLKLDEERWCVWMNAL